MKRITGLGTIEEGGRIRLDEPIPVAIELRAIVSHFAALLFLAGFE
jgi:hypothetical protein